MADDNATPTSDNAPEQLPATGDLGDAGKQAIDRMKAERDEASRKAKSFEREFKAAQSRIDQLEAASLSDVEKATRRAELAEKELADMQVAAVRSRVALEKGLPASLVGRLQGTTEQELAADADELLALVRSPLTPRPDPSQGARGGDPKTSTADQFAAAIQGAFTT